MGARVSECRISRIYACALGRRVHTSRRTRAFHVSPRFRTCIYVRRRLEGEKERKRDTLPSRCSRDGGGAQSFTDPLSPTQTLSHASARTTRARANTYTHAPHARARARFDFPIQSFPSGETRTDSCRETHFVFGLV